MSARSMPSLIMASKLVVVSGVFICLRCVSACNSLPGYCLDIVFTLLVHARAAFTPHAVWPVLQQIRGSGTAMHHFKRGLTGQQCKLSFISLSCKQRVRSSSITPRSHPATMSGFGMRSLPCGRKPSGGSISSVNTWRMNLHSVDHSL